MRLVLGFGARSAATADDVAALLPPLDGAVVALSTVDGRADLARELASRRGWEVVTHPAEALAGVQVPTPSATVAAHAGTPSVAEAAALLTARATGPALLLLDKRSSAVATVAVAALAPAVTVVGIGADGLGSLAPDGRAALAAATVLFGSARQLDLVTDVTGADIVTGAGVHRVAWPSPLVPALPRLLAEHHAGRVVVLASGDPMFHGIGTTLVRLLGAAHVHVVPHPSAVSLACARLGWALDDVEVVSAVGRSVDALRRVLHDGRRVLILSAGAGTPAQVVQILRETGFGGSDVTVLESLGGPDERVHHDADRAGPLNVVAVDCRGGGGIPVVPGLADGSYTSDGQLTKREIRAVTLAALGPRPGELLWDVGAGSGSIAIEWLRAHRSCRAVAVERDPVRAGRVTANAGALGVPHLSTVVGAAPEALDGLAPPDAVFIGGGFTAAGVFERCWSALRPGGRLVVNAVTVESERLVADLHATHGGELTRIAVQRAAPVGGFLAWRPMMPVTQWVVWK
ncbi:precorrin-6y C5,15-methyltransferase (decarboxylating) subunit CbiE [Dactylosporangium sp. NBC_01737]|uniref:precorrin-6y C5,15-methyltransferase (decarboxylating) subunit CbiE n=1 Tax=Dactylosporangium sp. NBC_01737 TaxID=2975959 RepID=UPI002E15FBCD|nr:precorrin-6y C5,15-methyltransferase (decarboxylating) subunit CbiE [Dactylosporangium sp. NBC_01737]